MLLDGGRAALRGTDLEEALDCIRCGACLYSCPMWRSVGGQAYGSPYSGPIGAVVTPLLEGMGGERSSEMPFLSSLCGSCHDACPVGIPLHDLLVRVRARVTTPAHRRDRALFALWSRAWSSPALYSRGWRARVGLRLGGRRGWIRRLPGPGRLDLAARPAHALAAEVADLAERSWPTLCAAAPPAERDGRRRGPRGRGPGRRVGRRPRAAGRRSAARRARRGRRPRRGGLRAAALAAGPRPGWRDLLGLDGSAQTCGVTVPILAVAERGTLVLATGPGHGRSIDVVSMHHLAILPASRIRETLAEALGETYRGGGRAPSAVSLVSGPSRTSDIEKISTLGAHGALAMHVLVVGTSDRRAGGRYSCGSAPGPIHLMTPPGKDSPCVEYRSPASPSPSRPPSPPPPPRRRSRPGPRPPATRSSPRRRGPPAPPRARSSPPRATSTRAPRSRSARTSRSTSRRS